RASWTCLRERTSRATARNSIRPRPPGSCAPPVSAHDSAYSAATRSLCAAVGLASSSRHDLTLINEIDAIDSFRCVTISVTYEHALRRRCPHPYPLAHAGRGAGYVGTS